MHQFYQFSFPLAIKNKAQNPLTAQISIDLYSLEAAESTTIIIRQILMKLRTKQLITLTCLILFVQLSFTQDISPNSCIEYSVGTCIRCERQTHLYEGVCYTNILGCLSYSAGTNCRQCDPTDFVLNNNRCDLLPGKTATSELLANLYKYSGVAEVDPGSQYGEAGFIPTTFEKVQKLPSFIALNTFIRTGQYSHFISRTGNPIYSVHYYITDNRYSYKVLYYGSGGGLFLCIADVPPALNVQLRSLTPISSSNIVDNCTDYDTSSNCLRCGDKYHLENKKCYPNSGACIRYRENLCIQCLDFYFLVENRCVSDCVSVSDARSLLYYENSINQSTLETYYGISISRFYTFTVRNTTNTITTFTTSTSTGGSSSGAGTGSGTVSIFGSGIGTGTGTGSASSSISSSSSFTSFSSSSSSSSSGTSGSSSNFVDPSSISVIPSSISSGTIVLNTTNTSTTTLPNSLTVTTVRTTTTTTSTGGVIEVDGKDPNCQFYDPSGPCLKCSQFYFKNKDNVCQLVNPLCGTYNETTGACLSCYPGYRLQKDDCVIIS